MVDAAAVAPLVVHQRRAHAAAAVAVAADAIHLAEELLPFGDRGRIIVVELGAGIEGLRSSAARPDRVGTFTRGHGLTDGLGAAVPFLAVAGGQRQRRNGEKGEANAAG